MHKYRGSFSYENNHTYNVEINANLHLTVEKVNLDIARIYFADSQNNQVAIPNGYTLTNITHNNALVPITNLGGLQQWLITWFSSYSLRLNGSEFLGLDNQKQQSVRGNFNSNAVNVV